MTGPLYLAPSEVAIVPGRFQDLWKSLTDPSIPASFSTGQAELVAEASAEVDRRTGQHGGLAQQRAKTLLVTVRETGNVLFLPNKPITAVTAIAVWRAGVARSYDCTGDAIVLGRGEAVEYRPISSVGIPPGLVATTWLQDGQYGSFAAGDEVTVTYDCGYPSDAIPAGVKQATRRILAKHVMTLFANAAGVAEERQGRGNQVRWEGQSEDLAERDIRASLTPYTIAAR